MRDEAYGCVWVITSTQYPSSVPGGDVYWMCASGFISIMWYVVCVYNVGMCSMDFRMNFSF